MATDALDARRAWDMCVVEADTPRVRTAQHPSPSAVTFNCHIHDDNDDDDNDDDDNDDDDNGDDDPDDDTALPTQTIPSSQRLAPLELLALLFSSSSYFFDMAFCQAKKSLKSLEPPGPGTATSADHSIPHRGLWLALAAARRTLTVTSPRRRRPSVFIATERPRSTRRICSVVQMHSGSGFVMDQGVGLQEGPATSPLHAEPLGVQLSWDEHGVEPRPVDENDASGPVSTADGSAECDDEMRSSVINHPSQGPSSSRALTYTCDFILFSDDDSGALNGDGLFPPDEAAVDDLGHPQSRDRPEACLRHTAAPMGSRFEADHQSIGTIGAWGDAGHHDDSFRVSSVDFDRELDRALLPQTPLMPQLRIEDGPEAVSTEATFCACCECEDMSTIIQGEYCASSEQVDL
ncbi:hypothetical protein O9K51_03722 [Purpureocillium lavendulum]|uniref:Uncharacterized protein n=1 Tax=Purpureocillium lavendulum TaxID=1247861 RepID=A0AB34FW02_9HYPO|nr:hypothetical protein O9K51_03722 [Purpureocillium lavendulum]